MKAHEFKDQAAQGDCLLTRVNAVPSGFTKIKTKDAEFAVAHSETGHHHVMRTTDAEFFEAANDPLMLYIVVNESTELRHLRSFDTHAPIRVDKGIYRVNRQREYVPEGWRRAAD